MRTEKRLALAESRHKRLRAKIVGSAARPRMSVRFTGKNIHVQFIDDLIGKTLAAVSTTSKSFASVEHLGANVTTAKQVGSEAARVAMVAGITKVVFDRSGSRYHGKVKALADAAREAGLQF